VGTPELQIADFRLKTNLKSAIRNLKFPRSLPIYERPSLMNIQLSSLLIFLSPALAGATQPTAVPERPNPAKIELRTAEASVPMHWFGKRPVVEVKINEKGPYRFFLDTGAQGSVLDQGLADELKLPVVGKARVGSPGGKGLPANQVRLDQVEVGAAVLSGVPAVAFDRAILDLSEDTPRGVLSASTFPGFLVTLDYPQSRLVIRRGQLPAANGTRVFAYDAKRPLPEIRLSVAGEDATVHLDSGSPGGIMLPLALAERLPLASKPVEVARGERVDQDVVILGAKLNGQVTLGQYVLKNPDLRFQDIAQAPGHVGYEFLRGFAVTLDAANHRVQLVRQDEGPVSDKKDLEQLQGEWVMVSSERAGKKLSEKEISTFRRTIKGNKYTVTFEAEDGGHELHGTITLDPTKKPKAIDAVRSEGESKGKPMQGIYELDGAFQKVCFAPVGKERPTEFTSKAGTEHVLTVWKRVDRQRPAEPKQAEKTAKDRPGTTGQPPEVTWESLDARMKWEADQGFSGVVLVARDGKTVFHKAYGMANREKKIAMRPDTILAIGSTPIDFTKAAILLLAEAGKLSLEDPITKHFDKVPKDMKSVTIAHLMTGRSGLPDFHHLPTDRNRDHSWIDRAEAVRRIFDQKLLFEPGKERKHSHSAFGLLAAIVEIVSGQTYQEFTREHLFKPAWMTDTGFHGDKYAEERMAVGYGPFTDGMVNAPPYWGKTSWLVMGSGGQVSTAQDMWRWTKAVKGGKILSKESLKLYSGPGEGMLVGGDEHGFYIMYAGNPRSFMVVMSNELSPRRTPQLDRLGQELTALVSERKPAKFTLGVQLKVTEGSPVKVEGVAKGGAAERAGLRPGDVLLNAAGKPLSDDPGAVLGPLLQSGEVIEFEIERDGKRQTVKVKPALR
jgi:uncharacterized protein (TIGR03067 family)